jgi:hypothetical protein
MERSAKADVLRARRMFSRRRPPAADSQLLQLPGVAQDMAA